MIKTDWKDDQRVSLFALATSLLRNRWRLARWVLIGVVAAAAWVFTRPPKYVSSASFIPQTTDVSRSGLASLAGQFGVTLSSGNQSLSPEFYSSLIKSKVLLGRVVRDTVAVPEEGQKRIAFLDLFEVHGRGRRREEEGIRVLFDLVKTDVVKSTGVVELSVATKWPSVSFAIANALVSGVNDFNQTTRQTQATAERKFVEGRLAVAASDLRAAEDRLESFLRSNREYGSSPELTFERERLQRAVSLTQQVYTSLTQSYEEVRIREVRDTPVITVVESPSVAAMPEPRGRIKGLLLGLIIGSLVGAIAIYFSEAMKLRRKNGDPEADEFVGTLGELKGEVLGRVKRIGLRVRL